jgi:hypothetical protein
VCEQLIVGLGRDRVDFVASGAFISLLVCLLLLLLAPLGYRGYVRYARPPLDPQTEQGLQSEMLTTTFYSAKDLRDYERVGRPAPALAPLPLPPPKSPLALLWRTGADALGSPR